MRFQWRSAFSNRCDLKALRFRCAIWAFKIQPFFGKHLCTRNPRNAAAAWWRVRERKASTLSPLVAALRRHVQEGRLGAQDLASGRAASKPNKAESHGHHLSEVIRRAISPLQALKPQLPHRTTIRFTKTMPWIENPRA